MKTKNFYSIAPLIKLPLGRAPFFTYYSNEKILLGSLVQINFANKNIKGVVWKSTPKPRVKFKIKPIEKIITPSLLTSKQRQLAQKIAAHYLCPLGIVLKFFTPRLTKSTTDYADYADLPHKKIKLTDPQKTAVKKIKSLTCRQANYLLTGPASSGKTEVILGAIRKLSKETQTLVLVPEVFLSYQEIARYSAALENKNVALYHSGLKNSQITYVWNNLKNGKIDVVVATRAGLFLPFKKLSLIVIDEEQDISFKQWDQVPYYHTHQVASFLANLYKSKTILSSATPSLKIDNKELRIVTLPSITKKPNLNFVDLKKYWTKKKQLIISNELKDAIKENLKQKKVALLLVPRRGKSKLVICQDCRKSFKCPKCKHSLIHRADSYYCFNCHYQASGFSQCPNCKSLRLADIGFGTEKVASTLKTIFPKAKVSRADRDAFTQEKNRQKIFQKLLNNKIDILVGTYTICKGLDLPNVNLVGVLNADDWPVQSNYRFDEHWLGNLFQLAGRVNRFGTDQNGQCLIQTFNPNNPLFESLKKWDWNSFAKEELKNRKALKWPPFSKISLLSYTDKNKSKLEKNANKLIEKIKKQDISQIIEILPPRLDPRPKKGLYKIEIVIKIKLGDLPEKLKSILTKEKDWKVNF